MKQPSKARLWGAGIVLSAAVMLSGCGASGSETAGTAEALYKKKCLSCHGEKLEGRIGPPTNLTQVGAKLTRDQIADQIAKGGRGMPGFSGSLNETEIGTLADWLAEKK
ncbi:c-type cytochrome [Paenibacillus sp. GCM10012303]|uniref:c-type cytochrome n=1 Tax=Paenibacillus sp. GCM10012303 TaxID=3317340 RepID=UPI00361794E6